LQKCTVMKHVPADSESAAAIAYSLTNYATFS